MNEFRRTKQPAKLNSVRKELENIVIAWNIHLKKVVPKMSTILLLRNCSPIFRSDYAYKLKNEGLIKENQIAEFIMHPQSKINYSHVMHA